MNYFNIKLQVLVKKFLKLLFEKFFDKNFVLFDILQVFLKVA